MHPLNCLTHKAQPFIWTPECQASFNMLCSRLANTPIVQLPNPNKPYLLFTDTTKFCYSGVLTQASTQDSNEALLKILPNDAPLKSDECQMLSLQLESKIIHPTTYKSGSFSQSQCWWPVITKECLSIFMPIKKYSFYLQNADLLVCSDHKPPLKIFTGHTDNYKCNTWGLEATTIPSRVKVKHINRIANSCWLCIKAQSSTVLSWYWLRGPPTGIQCAIWALPSCWVRCSYAVRGEWSFHCTLCWKTNANLWHISWLTSWTN